jgi:hypothetical protein
MAIPPKWYQVSLQVPMSRDVAQMLCLNPAQWLDDTGFPLSLRSLSHRNSSQYCEMESNIASVLSRTLRVSRLSLIRI